MVMRLAAAFPLLLLAAPCAAGEPPKAPPPAELSDRIERMIQQLDDDEFAKREKAQAEILEIGEPALGPLERFLAGEPGVEARERAERLLKEEIPKAVRQKALAKTLRRIEGGAAHCGIRLKLAIEKDQLRTGDVASFHLVAENVDAVERPFSPIFYLEHLLPDGRYRSSSSSARFELRSLSNGSSGIFSDVIG